MPQHVTMLRDNGVFWIILITWYFGLHLISYFLYRICAYYCKWTKSEKNIYDHFNDVVTFVVLTFLYVLAGNYWDMFNCSVQKLILEYIFPFLISLFFSGFVCQVSYFRVSFVEVKTWNIKSWLMIAFLSCIFLFLIVITFILSDNKDLFFLPIIPCVIYFIGALVISCISRHPSLKFHPRSYQIAFALCLLRKENNFYSRLFAALSTGIFVRCISANPILSILEPVEEELVLSLSSRNSPSPQIVEINIPSDIPNEIHSPLLEENEELMLETIEKYNRGEIDDVNVYQTRNEEILEADERECPCF